MHRQNGFTLLEIMVVLSFLVVMITLVGGSISGTNKIALKADRYMSSLDECRAAQVFLRSSISQTLGPEASQKYEVSSERFRGAAQRLQFSAPISSYLGGGIGQYTVALGGPVSKRNLQVTIAQLQGNVARDFGEPQVLLHGVRNLSISYRGLTPNGRYTGWVPIWPWAKSLPRAVRIQVELQGPDCWTTQIVALRLDMPFRTGGGP